MKTKPSIYPAGATNANWFSMFNAVSFQITLGSPMILYAKSLGATATVLGIIAAMGPLLTTAQIPAARHLGRVGYRRFILMGWGSRTIFIFLIAAVPLLAFLNNPGKIEVIVFALFVFNLLRGISSGAWLPWLTDLIPQDVRGRFLSRDQLFMHFGSLVSLTLSALILRGNAHPWQFSLVFVISACGGVASLLFLNRIPDIPAHETINKSNMRVPWREIVAHPPFFRLVVFNGLFAFTAGSLGVFTVAFMKARIGYSESRILYLTTLTFVGAMITLPLIGRVLDRVGSKPILRLSLAVYALLILGWALLASGVIAPSLVLIGALQFVAGIAGPNFNLANVRITMNTMPQMGRSHFFAIFSVISSLMLGLGPLLWGVCLDAIGSHRASWGGLEWNKFSVFYFTLLALNLVTLLLAAALHEQPVHGERIDPRDTVFQGNLKRMSRFWQR